MPGTGKGMRISSISSLARVVDPRYPTNLAILIIATLAGGGYLIYNLYAGTDLLSAFGAAFVFAVGIFLTWALGREIDPEHELAAFAGLLLFIPGFLVLGAPDLIMLLTILLLVRMLNQTTGLQPKFLDLLAIIALGSVLLVRGAWIFGFFCTAAFILEAWLGKLRNRYLVLSALMALLTLASFLIFKPWIPSTGIPLAQVGFVISVALVFIPLVLHTRKIEVICDYQPERLKPVRVQAGQVFAFSSAILVWIIAGYSGIIALLPLWSSFIGLSVGYLTSIFTERIK
jgi:hypothetical protein